MELGPKPLAEDCRVVSTSLLMRRGLLRPWTYTVGELRWNDGWVLGVEVQTVSAEPSVRFTYTALDSREEMDYQVGLKAIGAPRGGVRFLFFCPLVSDGHVCGRLGEKLYLAPGRCFLSCRRCAGISYLSRKDRKAA